MADSNNLKRIEITYFDGVNTLVGPNISKKEELEHVENAHSDVIGTIETRKGYTLTGDAISSTENFSLFYFKNTTSTNTGLYRISKVGSTTSIYYLNTSNAWISLTGLGTSLLTTTGEYFSFARAEKCLFLSNGTDKNRYISSDGTTVIDSDNSAGHLYNSPKARKINYYKDRLYLGDYTNTTRYQNGVMRSSVPLGIVSLVSGDFDAGVTEIDVTDTKYIRVNPHDTLDVYRGSAKITTLTVTAKTEDSITVNATSVAINSADELWVANTYTGVKLFRWADNPSSGINVKEYDTFKLAGGDNEPLTMLTNIGNVQMIGNKDNLAIWNNSSLQNFDLGIGCVSENGYVKNLGTLWFLHYTGIYSTAGDIPKLMSAKVEKYIKGATRSGLETCAAGKKGYSVFFSIGNVTLYYPDGSMDKTLNNVVLEYNLRQENWYVHTGIDSKLFATYIEDVDPDKLEWCGSSGNVYELFNSQKDLTSDIPMMINTTPITLSKQFEKISYPKEIIVEMDRGNTVKSFISLDGAPFYEISGEANKGCTILKVTNRNEEREKPPRCRNIRISLREFSGVSCRLLRIAIIYAESSEEEEFKESYGR